MGKEKKKVVFYRHIIFAMLFAATASGIYQGSFYILLKSLTSSNIEYNKIGSEQSIEENKHIVQLIKILFFIIFYIKIRPIYGYLVQKKEELKTLAIERYNDIYKFIAYFFIASMLAMNINFIISRFGNAGAVRDYFYYFLPSTLFGAYYSIYFAIAYLEPFLFSKLADKFYDDKSIYTRKKGLSLSIGSRLFFTILNLLVIPMIIIICYAYLIPNINPDSDKFIVGSDEIKRSIMLLMMSKVNLLGIAIISLIYSIGYTEMLYKSIKRPIDELVKKMDRLASGDFDVKTTVLSDDEIGNLKYNFNVMVDGLGERERLRETFGRYVSIEIAKHLMSTNNIDLGGEDIKATILFSDIRNFTSMSEKMSAREVVDFLNEYFSYITEPIIKNHGVINKFIGDAVMAIYIPHLGSADHVDDAVKSAIGMRKRLEEFNAAKKIPGEVRFGIGIHTGNLVAGNIGTQDRLEYTVIGDTVNVASRIESENKSFSSDILISEETFSLAGDEIKKANKFEKCDPVSVKGKEKPLILYKIS